MAVAEQVQDAVAQAPDGERRGDRAGLLGGHTYREVATMLGEPEGTVKSRIRAGLKRMRRRAASTPASGVRMSVDEPHPREIEELLGAYALDAVDGDEREAVELHLPSARAAGPRWPSTARWPRCSPTPARPRPTGVWDRIASSLEEPPPQMRIEVGPEGGTVVPLAPRPSRSRDVASCRSPARRCGRDHRRPRASRSSGSTIGSAPWTTRRPRRRWRAARSSTRASRRGTLELHDGSVAGPGRDHTRRLGLPARRQHSCSRAAGSCYQLWGMHGTEPISLGSSTDRSEVVPFHVGPGITALGGRPRNRPPASRSPRRIPIGQLAIRI